MYAYKCVRYTHSARGRDWARRRAVRRFFLFARPIDDALAIANAIPFGLGSSVWTSDPAEEARFVRDVQAGMTAVNQMLASAPEAPFGGVKRSGHGRELGPFGLHEFMNLKSVYRK